MGAFKRFILSFIEYTDASDDREMLMKGGWDDD